MAQQVGLFFQGKKMNTLLIKEINYTKNGRTKTLKDGTKQLQKSVHSLKKSLSHSLRLDDKNYNWDKEKSYQNDYGTFGKSDEELKNNYEKLFENIEKLTTQKTTEDKKVAKKFNNLKYKLSKRFKINSEEICNLIDNNLDLDTEEIFNLLSKTYNYKDYKEFQKKQSLDQIESYIKTKSEYLQSCYTYKNETIMKEIIFTIPGESGEFSEEDLKSINLILKNLYPNNKIDLICHNDENKKHYHAFIQGWDKENNFNLQKDLQSFIETKIIKDDSYNLKDNLEKTSYRQKILQNIMLKFFNRSYETPKFGRKKYDSEEEKEYHRMEIEKDVDRNMKDRKYNYYTLKEGKLMEKLSKIEEDIKYYNNEILQYTESIDEKNVELLKLNEVWDNMVSIRSNLNLLSQKIYNTELSIEEKIKLTEETKLELEQLEKEEKSFTEMIAAIQADDSYRQSFKKHIHKHISEQEAKSQGNKKQPTSSPFKRS